LNTNHNTATKHKNKQKIFQSPSIQFFHMISAYEKIELHLKIFCFVLWVLFVFMDFVGFWDITRRDQTA